MTTIIFDLDGVLVDAKLIHYKSLNMALAEVGERYTIPWELHLSTFDGLKTSQKLDILTEKMGLPAHEHKRIWQRKQEITQELINDLDRDYRLIDIFIHLRKSGYTLACCSNSIRRSVFLMLAKIGIVEYMDLILSNEDVQNSKPHPEIYWKAMSILGALPEGTLVIEDSPPGLLAAHLSGAAVMRVANPNDLTYDKICNKLNSLNQSITPKWQGGIMNIVIPMAGAGSRFQKAGYEFPKPLIDVGGKTMIQRVVDNVNINARYIFIVQKEHREKYNLDMMFKLIAPDFEVVETEGITQGAACTILLAQEYINNDDPMLLVNSDQLIEWNSNDFMYKMQEHKSDGCILTFTSTHPMYSFAKVNEHNVVTEVAEKNPISDQATVGFYYWSRGSDFVKYANQMIDKNIRVNNEFYSCPVYNEAIQDGKEITAYHVNKMWPLGTPDQLLYYLENGLNK